jgi:hypothetical protein
MVCNQGLYNTCLETITSLTHSPNVTMLLQKGFCPQGTLILLNVSLTNQHDVAFPYQTESRPHNLHLASGWVRCFSNTQMSSTVSCNVDPIIASNAFIFYPHASLICSLQWMIWIFFLSLVTLDHIWFWFTVLGQFTRPMPKNLNFRFPL